jgi:hypothetical protein
MRELIFALQFRGRGEDVPGEPGRRRARSAAPSQMLSTLLGPDGIRTRVDLGPGDAAVLEARVERFGDGTFVEDGTIMYGAAGAITFATDGRGRVMPASQPGAVHGAVIWTITGGAGAFAGASGFITSNFAVSATGEVVDYHVTRLQLPD